MTSWRSKSLCTAPTFSRSDGDGWWARYQFLLVEERNFTCMFVFFACEQFQSLNLNCLKIDISIFLTHFDDLILPGHFLQWVPPLFFGFLLKRYSKSLTNLLLLEDPNVPILLEDPNRVPVRSFETQDRWHAYDSFAISGSLGITKSLLDPAGLKVRFQTRQVGKTSTFQRVPMKP